MSKETHCLICGGPLEGCQCPRCGFDLSLDREANPTLSAEGEALPPLWVRRDLFVRKLLDAAKPNAEPFRAPVPERPAPDKDAPEAPVPDAQEPKTVPEPEPDPGPEQETPPAGGFSKGDTVYFGRYYYAQDSTKRKPLPWTVLDVSASHVLLLCRDLIEFLPFHTAWENVSWEDCSLRAWLNNAFPELAFSEEEQERISEAECSTEKRRSFGRQEYLATRDKVFLLSAAEAEAYLGSDEDRSCEATPYALAHLPYNGNADRSYEWWLRTPGKIKSLTAIVNAFGQVDLSGTRENRHDVGVRPALWINLTEQGTEETQ